MVHCSRKPPNFRGESRRSERSSSCQGDSKQPRNWRDIAKEAGTENDPNRVLKLAHELIRALDVESNKHVGHHTPSTKWLVCAGFIRLHRTDRLPFACEGCLHNHREF